MTTLEALIMVIGLLSILVLILFAILVGAIKRTRTLTMELNDLSSNLDKETDKRIAQSRSVLLGQVAEHLAPLLPGFPWHSKDARFLGQPIDYIIFDGLEEGREVTLTLVEIKTGKATLSQSERAIRDAIQAGRVRFEVFRPDQDLGSLGRK